MFQRLLFRLGQLVLRKPRRQAPALLPTFAENPTYRANCIASLLKIKSILDSFAIPFWLDWGTLLGCVRDGDLIPHDNDIDVGILAESWTPQLAQALRDHGFLLHPTYCYPCLIDRFFAGEPPSVPRSIGLRHKSIPVGLAWMDVYLYFAGPGIRFTDRSRYWYTYSGFLECRAWQVENWEQTSFLGTTFRIPADAPSYLKNIYGATWKVPIATLGDELTEFYPNYVQLSPEDKTSELTGFLYSKNPTVFAATASSCCPGPLPCPGFTPSSR